MRYWQSGSSCESCVRKLSWMGVRLKMRCFTPLRLPILYLQASKDLIVPASAARLVQDLAPQTELVRIAGSHFLLQSKPAVALGHIQQFIAQNVVDDCAYSFSA